jgi:hypothetical protein
MAENTDSTTASIEETYPQFKLEGAALDLTAAIGVLRHLSRSPLEVSDSEWSVAAASTEKIADEYQAAYEAVVARMRDQKTEHKAALAAAQVERAAPGSPMDLEQAARHWRVLTTVATMVLKDAIARESTDVQG